VKEIYFAENLKRFREAKGLTREELGNRIGVSGAMVGYWEKKKNEPRMGKVQLIADILNVGVDELLFSEPPVHQSLINEYDNLTDLQKRGIDALLSISEDELELFVTLLEKNAKK